MSDLLDALYAKLLGFGFTALREALHAQNFEWADAEIKFLHNVPSLLGESNVERHRYFWFSEREHYVQWVAQPGRDRPQSRMRVYYEPVWREMEPILLEWFGEECAHEPRSAS